MSEDRRILNTAIVAGSRTSFARSGSVFADLRAIELGKVAVRDARHKTILYCNPKMQAKVFDLKADPLEMKNLVDTPEGKAVMVNHKNRILEYLDTVELYEPPGKAKNRTHELYLNYYNKLREEAKR